MNKLRFSKLDLNSKLKTLAVSLWQLTSFVLLLFLYLLAKGINKINSKLKIKSERLKKIGLVFSESYFKLTKFLDLQKKGTISRFDLIELSLRNMQARKARTAVTIGGMTIGIAAVVFLVSIGYGLQSLVISRVARLEEMKQAEVFPQPGSKVKINDKTLADFKQIADVKMVLPLIAVAGRVNYQNSVSDMAVYGVTADYLKQSAIKPVVGKIFESNELVTDISDIGQVAGVASKKTISAFGEKIQDVDYAIEPTVWIRVREKPTTSAKILGYTKRLEGSSIGEEVWGVSYQLDDNAGKAGETEDGEYLGKWIKAPLLLWRKEKCDPESQGDCENGNYMVMRYEDNKQMQKEGYFAEINIKVSSMEQASVLGITSDTSIDWVEIATEAGIAELQEIKTVELGFLAKREAVVNRAFLKVLGIKEDEAVGKTFAVSFTVVGELLSEAKEKIESLPAEYTIIGVTPEEKTPFFYVPFVDIRSLGLQNFSQIKAVVGDQHNLDKVRKQIEAMGFITQSVADTVVQISNLFSVGRIILALLGMVALAVATLGMFNTLTVSLLERTREVGLMKALGMKSEEVKELFLTESMIMGFFGGVLGIMVGFIMGKLAGLALSFFAILKGVGFIDISYVPFSFIVVIVFLSFLVGIATGIYPARRATKISALNALRYE